LFSLAFLSLACLWYNNSSETAVYMIFLAGGNGSLNVWYLKKASSSLGRLFSCACCPAPSGWQNEAFTKGAVKK
jgi:hypothetical protein